MLIQWLIIFFVLENFIVSDSDGSPVSFIENEQRLKGDDDVNYPNEGFHSSSEANDSEVSVNTRKNSTCLNQETTDRRRNENEKSFIDDNHQRLIFALSKIAKVQSSDPDERCSMANVYNAAQNKSMYLQRKISEKIIREPIPPEKKLSSNLSEDLFNNVSNGGIQQGNDFPCRAIQDIYIPEIKEKIPSYTCTIGNVTFFLSSKRFFQDRRSSLHINIDNDTLRKLNSFTNSTNSTNNQFNIIPAILVLKPFHENYDVRNPQNFQDQV